MHTSRSPSLKNEIETLKTRSDSVPALALQGLRQAICRARVAHQPGESGVEALRKVADHLQGHPVVLLLLRQVHEPAVLAHPLQQVHKALQAAALVALQLQQAVQRLDRLKVDILRDAVPPEPLALGAGLVHQCDHPGGLIGVECRSWVRNYE